MSDDPFAPFRSRRARVVTLTLGAVAVPVSYTHLDVYKRQEEQ